MPQQFGFDLTTPPAPASPTPSEIASSTARGQPKFLGYGLLTPFQRDQKNDFANGGGLAVVRSDVSQALGIKAGTPNSAGEVPWRTNMGSRLHLLRHRNRNAAFPEIARVYASEALAQWVPAVSNVHVDQLIDRDKRTTTLRVNFDVVDRAGRVVASNIEALVPFSSE